MKKFIRCAAAAAVLAVGFLAASAKAAPINLASAPPDVLSSFVSESYNATTKTFTATGTATQLTLPPNTVSTITGGAFSLSAVFTISGSGSTETLTPTSGSLSVTGAGGTHTYFSSSVLQNIGFTTNSTGSSGITSQVFEFVFGPGSGDFGAGKIGVIIASQVNAPYATSFFDANFNNTANNLNLSATADTFAQAVPLPSAAFMGLSLLPLLVVFRRRRA